MKKLSLFIMFFFIFSFSSFSQQSNELDEEQLNELQKAGAWLISKSDADFDNIGKLLSKLIADNIIPQALDRNIVGELLIISQLSPPALKATQWHLGVYESESEMMGAMEVLAKEGWTPTGMDIQEDAAFVLYVFSTETLSGARLIKVKNIDELSNSINVYYNLGYIPAAISTFMDTLWILYTSIFKEDISKSDVLIRILPKDDTPKTLIKELSDNDTSLIDVTYTADDKVLMLFHQRNSNKSKKR